MTRMILGHARRSVLVLLVPVVIAMYGFGFVSMFNEWRWEWDLGTLLPGATFYLAGPVVAAGAAFEACRARSTTAELAPSRAHGLRSVWPSFVLISVTMLAIWVVIQLATVVVLVASDAFGQARWPHVLTQVLAIFAFTAVGSLAGALFPRVWIPPLLGLVIWGSMAATVQTELLFPSAAVASLADVPLPLDRVLWLSLFYVALVAVVLPYPLHWRPFTSAVRMAGAAGAVVMALVLWNMTSSHPEPSLEVSACADVTASVEVCTTDTYARALPYLVATIRETAEPIMGLGVMLPSPIIVVNSWADAGQFRDDGIVIGVSSGQLKEGWKASGDVWPKEFRDVAILQLSRGNCIEWSSMEGPGWSQDTAAQVQREWLLSQFFEDVDVYVTRWYELDEQVRTEALPRLFAATYRCDVPELEKIFHDLGVEGEW